MLKKIYISFTFMIMVFLAGLPDANFALAAPAPQAGDRLSVAGMVQNPQGRGVKEVEVEVLVNGQHVKPAKDDEIATGKSGSFLAEFILPAGTLPGAKVEVTAFKPSWKKLAPTTVQVYEAGTDKDGNKLFQTQVLSVCPGPLPRLFGLPRSFYCWCMSLLRRN